MSWRWAVLFGVWACVLAGAAWRFWLHPASVAGGPVLVYEIDVQHPYERGLLPSEIEERTTEAIQARVGRLARVSEVRAEGKRVEVRLARGTAVDAIKRSLLIRARLELKRVDDGSDFMKRLVTLVHSPVVKVDRDGWTEKASGAVHQDEYLSAPGVAEMQDLLRTLSIELPEDHELAFENVEKHLWRSYYLFRETELSNEDVDAAEVNWDPGTGRPEVSLQFTEDASQRFERFTERSVGRKLAILIDGKIQTAPVIESKIAGGRARITMGGLGEPEKLLQDAKDLVSVLRAGALPAPIRLVEQR